MRSPAGEQSVRLNLAAPLELRTDMLRTLQRLAGNQATLLALTAIQRDEPAPASPPGEVGTEPPGRLPKDRDELDTWGAAFPDAATANFRIVVEPVSGYNCFAWAVGVTSMEITYQTLQKAGYDHNLDGWTKYLAERHGLGRLVDGLDPTADVILYGESATQVWHAARRAEVPYGPMTFTSKLGGQNKSPVILHAPADLNGGGYGHALRSFWRGPADQAAPGSPPATTP